MWQRPRRTLRSDTIRDHLRGPIKGLAIGELRLRSFSLQSLNLQQIRRLKHVMWESGGVTQAGPRFAMQWTSPKAAVPKTVCFGILSPAGSRHADRPRDTAWGVTCLGGEIKVTPKIVPFSKNNTTLIIQFHNTNKVETPAVSTPCSQRPPRRARRRPQRPPGSPGSRRFDTIV